MSMSTVVRARLTHLCPFVDELDIGDVEITFVGPAPELHDLAKMLRDFATERVTHEELTQRLATALGASVVSNWHTAGLDVEVRCERPS